MPKPNGGFPLALDAPVEPVNIIGRSQIGRALQTSRESPRGRIILPFHKTATDACHRMLNALQPGGGPPFDSSTQVPVILLITSINGLYSTGSHQGQDYLQVSGCGERSVRPAANPCAAWPSIINSHL